jgi:hypothetical protein
VLENDPGLVVAALIDERLFVGRAGVEFLVRLVGDHEGMADAERFLLEEISTRPFAPTGT